MDKTIVVAVERKFRHPTFKKVVVRAKKFYAHDENRCAKVGDEVQIVETRPLSKLKKWRLVGVVTSGTPQRAVNSDREG
jgi:small subunit ribosomal protein S17